MNNKLESAHDLMTDMLTEIDRLRAQLDELAAELRKIETICTESHSACLKRMGTRVGNILVAARSAIAKLEAR